MTSEAERQSPTSSSSGAQKHRACDECRSRKLACSKEQDGCSRCRREGLRCHYSVQKPMGRPRKRRNGDDGQQDLGQQRTSPLRQQKKARNAQKQLQSTFPSSADDQSNILLPLSGTLPADSHVSEFSPYDTSTMLPLNPSLSFLDDQRQGNAMNFLDVLPQSFSPTLPPSLASSAIMSSESMGQGSTTYSLDLGGGVDLQGGIGFEHHQEGSPMPRSAATRVMHDSFARYMVKSWTQQPQTTDSLSISTPQSNVSSDSSSSASIRPNPSISCGCLSSLYLTLDGLGNLPADIPAAIRTVRNASRVAHSTISCEFCSGKFLVDNVTQPVPIQAFQSLMLLAALVPSACNAYATILERVDIEADRARTNNQELWFSFREIGGHWGMEAEEGKDCLVMQTYNERRMPPDMWRATIREIIRVDVDGVEGGSSVDNHGGKGLRDVIKSLEERSHQRHAHIDAAAAMGYMPKHTLLIPMPHHPIPVEERHCMRVLDAARMALNNLVIA